MTSLNFQKQEINNMIEMFNTSIKHPYLQKYLKDPLVDKDKVAILLSMLKEKELGATYIDQSILATLLVQSALDTHEKVSEEPVQEDTAIRERQLTVLAGDYYSALYYYILAEISDVRLIQTLAKSIQEINESKMNIYKNQAKRVYASTEDIKVVDSSLLKNIAKIHELPEWEKFIEEFFYFKRLVKERYIWGSSKSKGSLTVMLWKEHSLKDEAEISEFLEKCIFLSKENILGMTSKWTGTKDRIESRIHEILKEYKLDKLHVMEER